MMLSFHNDVAIKEKYLARVRAHREADQLVHGIGWENGKGCAVGCTLEAYDHSRYPIELGIPLQLAHLEDCLFEGMPADDAMLWPERFLSAIPVGRDLSEVWPRFAIWLMGEVRPLARPDGQRAIDGVIAFYQLPPQERTEAKRRAAAADAAAYAAAEAAAASAAASAYAYAAYAAAYAAYAASAADAAPAAAAAAYAAALQVSYKHQADKLIELFDVPLPKREKPNGIIPQRRSD